MGYLMRFASFLSFNNYLGAIVLFALIIEIIMIPLQIKQQKNQIAQAKLAPKVRAITKKYDGRNDQVSMQKKQQETMELYQKENFSPFSGCLPLLIQLPVILALYNVIMRPLKYLCGISDSAIEKAGKIAEKVSGLKNIEHNQIALVRELNTNSELLEQCKSQVKEFANITDTLPNFKVGPFDLSVNPVDDLWPWLWIIPVAVFFGMFFTTKLMRRYTYQAPETADAQNAASMKIMNTVMPLMSAGIAFSMPAVIGCYWFFRNIISVVEKMIISKIMPLPVITEEEFRAAEKEYGAGKKVKKNKTQRDPNAPRPRSLHTIDFDDEPLPPPTPDVEEEEVKAEATEAAGESPIAPATLKDDKK